MGRHAILSASASHRWLECPPSARLEATYESEASIYAQEGTLAHEWAENELRRLVNLINLSDYHETKKDLQNNPFFSPAMYEHIEKYKSEIEEILIKVDGSIDIEKRIDFSHIVPEGFGTCDCLIQDKNSIIVIDLKYGMGVPVSAENNSQLKLYSLGAMKLNETAQKIINVIIQPRLNSVSSYEYKREELEEWAKEIEPIIKDAFSGKGEFKTGDHCKFCKHKLRCVKQMEEAFGVVELPTPEDLPIEKICEILDKKSSIEDYLKSIEAHALSRVKGGEALPGYKLVLSRTLRKYKNTDLVVEALEKAECPENCFKAKEPISIGQMEKVLGKGRFQEILGDLVVKPEGEPVLALASDKREEYIPETAEDVFGDILKGEL